MPEAYWALAARLARDPAGTRGSGLLQEFVLPRATAAAISGTVQSCGQRLGRIMDLLAELAGLKGDFPLLSEVAPMADDGALGLTVLNLETETKFSVRLLLGEAPVAAQPEESVRSRRCVHLLVHTSSQSA